MDKNHIIKLRERTGAGMMDCKKALIEADGDIDLAQCYLRLLSQPLTRLINIKDVTRKWNNEDYMKEARKTMGKEYKDVQFSYLLKLREVSEIKVGCIFVQNLKKRIEIINTIKDENKNLYHLGEELIHIRNDEYDSVGQLVLDMREKIRDKYDVLRFEFLNKMTGERFGIDCEEMDEERCGER